MKTREEKITEAIERMKLLKLDNACIRAFKKGDVWLSEGYGALYETSNETELLKVIKDIEEEYGLVVYHCIHNFFEFGECYSLLFVSDYDEEWDYDRENIKEGYVFAYVWNKDIPEYSEWGTIGYKSSFGGLIRTA